MCLNGSYGNNEFSYEEKAGRFKHVKTHRKHLVHINSMVKPLCPISSPIKRVFHPLPKCSQLVGWLVVLRINVDLAIFQPYLDLEAGDNQSLKIQVARPGIEPRSKM